MASTSSRSEDLSGNATTAAATKHPLLTKPLYAFDLPRALLPHLQVCQLLSPLRRGVEDGGASSSQDAAPAQPGPGTGACQVCPGAGPFGSVGEQRAHFRSDWHRLNLQLQVSGHAAKLMHQAQFDKACEDLDTASSAGATDDEQATVAAAANRAAREIDQVARVLSHLNIRSSRRNGSSTATPRASDSEDTDGADTPARASPFNGQAAHVWLQSRPEAPPEGQLADTQLGVHRALFQDISLAADQATHVIEAVQDMQLPPLRRQPDARTGWTGKRLKSGKAADAGKAMQMSILDGEGFIPGLQLTMESLLEEEDDFSDVFSDEDGSQTAQTNSSLGSAADPPPRIWTFVLMGGGHFAISAIAINPHVRTTRSKRHGEVEEKGLIILAHRTFHRYTTRKKQGGSQSAQDASGKFAKSAGAQLRRYGEESLRQDILTLLDLPGWRTLIERSERVWMRAGARAAKGVLYSWEGKKTSPLDALRRDGRLASLPIQAGRATIAEVLRCFFELTRVRLAHHTPQDFAVMEAQQQQAQARSRQKAEQRRAATAARQAKQAEQDAAAAARAKDVLSSQEKALRQRVERLVDMVQKGRVETLNAYLDKYGFDILEPATIDGSLPHWWRLQYAEHNRGSPVPGTLLQLAADGGSPEMVHYLLVEKRADPTVAVSALQTADQQEVLAPAAHRTAYDLASTKPARDVFRRMMAEQPDWYDWGRMDAGGARVPSALTTEMADAKAAKVKDRRALMREKARARAAKEEKADAAAAEQEEEAEEAQAPVAAPSHPTRNRLGGQGSARIIQEDATLTPEMRMRIEREKRARAAEERMKKLASS